MAIYDFFVSRNNAVSNTAAYIGHLGRLFYDSDNGVIKISDGVTPGGIFIPYNIATETTIGGIKAGPGANVSVDGTLTIDTAGLPLSFGDFTANTNILTLVNSDQDMVLATTGNAEVQLVGNIGFYQTNGLPPEIDRRYFSASDNGQIQIFVTATDSEGAVEIIGSTTGNIITPGTAGALLHLTGQLDTPCRAYYDGNNNYVSWVARRWNGNVATPTQVLAGQDVLRINATAATEAGVGNVALAQISIMALEDQTTTAQGSEINFIVTPVGQPATNRIEVANVNVANGVTATKATIQGNLTVNGNIIGNAVTTTATIGTGNITTLNVSGVTTLDSAVVVTSANVTVSANIKYDITSGHAVANNFNKNGGTVAADGRTGRLTSLADSIAKGSVATFTVNNTYVGLNDVIIVNIASGASVDSYAVAVTAVANGSFQVSVTNNGAGALAQALVFNFAVIKIS